MRSIFFFFLTIFSLFLFSQNKLNDDVLVGKEHIQNSLSHAVSLWEKYEYYDALKLLNDELIKANALELKKEETDLLIIISQIENDIGSHDQAFNTINRAVAIIEDLDYPLQRGKLSLTLGHIYFSKKDYDQAIKQYHSAAKLFKSNLKFELLTETNYALGCTYISKNNFNEANTYLKKAVSLSKRHHFNLHYGKALIKQSIISYNQNKFVDAESQAQDALSIASNSKNLKLLTECYKTLSQIKTSTKNHEEANINLQQYIMHKDSLNAIVNSHLFSEERVKYIIGSKDDVIKSQADEIIKKDKANSLTKLTTILSVSLIAILSFLVLALFKNNKIRLKTNNMLYTKNKELLVEKDRAEIAAKTKTNFLSTVTHELRTPLYAVTGLTNMLLEDNPKPEQISHLKSLKFSGDYLLNFINDILQINKIEANKVELDPEIFNLKHKVENIISALYNSIQENSISVHLDYSKNISEVFFGDQLKISQILINLIGNSIKFTKNGDIWVRVFSIKKVNKTYTIKIEIEDNGIGISKEKQQRMFESFSQGSVQINRKYGGTGLGLSIVKGLVNILKGKIGLTSQLGKGTLFYFEVPLEEAVNKTVLEKKLNFAEELSKITNNKINILIVEDNKINQMITKKIITKMNIDSEVIDNGEDAVKLVKTKNYDVILMDIHMPGISGFEATKRIRRFNKDITIFALTAITLQDKMDEFNEVGFNDIISKPFKQEDFEKKLLNAIAKTHKSQSISA